MRTDADILVTNEVAPLPELSLVARIDEAEEQPSGWAEHVFLAEAERRAATGPRRQHGGQDRNG